MSYPDYHHKQLLILIRGGFNTVPKIVNGIMGIPPEMGCTLRDGMSFEEYRERDLLIHKYQKRIKSMERYGMIRKIGETKNHHIIWAVTE